MRRLAQMMTTLLAIQVGRGIALCRAAGSWLAVGVGILVAGGLALPAMAAASLSYSLTDEERAWVAQHPVVRVASSADYGPFTFVENGVVRGMSAGSRCAPRRPAMARCGWRWPMAGSA